MLFIAIILVFVLYMALYLLWEAAAQPLSGVDGVLRALTHALTMPQHDVFMILRGLLLVTFLYVVADYLMSHTKRALKRRSPKTDTFKATFTESPDHVYRG